MKNDRRIKNTIKDINTMCLDYLSYVNGVNECAYSDRIVEYIIKRSKELEKLHNLRFENKNKSISKSKRNLER